MKPESIPDVPRGVVRFYNFLPLGNPFLGDVLARRGLRRRPSGPMPRKCSRFTAWLQS